MVAEAPRCASCSRIMRSSSSGPNRTVLSVSLGTLAEAGAAGALGTPNIKVLLGARDEAGSGADGATAPNIIVLAGLPAGGALGVTAPNIIVLFAALAGSGAAGATAPNIIVLLGCLAGQGADGATAPKPSGLFVRCEAVGSTGPGTLAPGAPNIMVRLAGADGVTEPMGPPGPAGTSGAPNIMVRLGEPAGGADVAGGAVSGVPAPGLAKNTWLQRVH